jgi:hypothetical protein
MVDHTGRLCREGMTAILAELDGIFDRLGSRALTGPDGKTEEAPIGRPFLCRQPKQVARIGRPPEGGTRRRASWTPGAMTSA